SAAVVWSVTRCPLRGGGENHVRVIVPAASSSTAAIAPSETPPSPRKVSSSASYSTVRVRAATADDAVKPCSCQLVPGGGSGGGGGSSVSQATRAKSATSAAIRFVGDGGPGARPGSSPERGGRSVSLRTVRDDVASPTGPPPRSAPGAADPVAAARPARHVLPSIVSTEDVSHVTVGAGGGRPSAMGRSSDQGFLIWARVPSSHLVRVRPPASARSSHASGQRDGDRNGARAVRARGQYCGYQKETTCRESDC